MKNMSILERLFLLAMWPYAKAVEFVGDAIDAVNWRGEGDE